MKYGIGTYVKILPSEKVNKRYHNMVGVVISTRNNPQGYTVRICRSGVPLELLLYEKEVCLGY